MRRGFLSAALVTGLLVACTSPPAAPRPSPSTAEEPARAAVASIPPAAPTTAPSATLRLGHVSPTALNWVEFVAEKRGLFADEGLAVETTFTSAAANSAQQLVAGELHVATGGADAFFRAIEAGADIVLVSGQARVPPYNLVVQPTIRSYADLRGKNVLIGGVKDPTVYFTVKMFEANGLRLDDVDLVYAGSTRDRYAALVSGSVAATLITQPFDLTAIAEGYPTLGWSGDYVQNYLFTGTAVARGWAASQHAILVRYLRATARASRWLEQPANKAEAVQILVDISKQDEPSVRATYELYFEQGKRVFYPDSRADPADVAGTLDARLALGEPRPTLPIERYLDQSYIDEALASLR